MYKTTVEENISCIYSFNGINLYHIRADKFKTNTVNVFFIDDLNRDTASINALVPAVMRRGCKPFPTFREITMQLEGLYGSSFDCGVVKKGERQILHFYMEYVSDKYAGNDTGLTAKAIELLFDILLNPVNANGAFSEKYTELEKENLKRLIESRVNDKNQYAVDRCYEEMCSGEPFGVYEYGSVENLKGITAKKLYEHYRQIILTVPMEIYVTGDFGEDDLKLITGKLSSVERGETKKPAKVENGKSINNVKEVTEKMRITQGKLSLGFRTNIASNEEEYYALLVYNSVLGGGMHSKLFQNVREKHGLAYYVYSRLEKFKGLMVISSGIDVANRDKVVGIIKQQFDEIKAGNISEYEYESALKSIETGLKSLKDNQLNVVDFYLGQSISNTQDSFEMIIDRVKRVSIKDIVNISGKIQLDTIYFLTGTASEK